MYTLKAMQYGSKAAARQVPRLLQIVEIYPDTLNNFKKKVKDIMLLLLLLLMMMMLLLMFC